MNGFQYKYGDRPLEGYTIQRAIGRGGFGEVYFALSDAGREVALKAIQGYEQIELRGVSQCMNLKSPHLVAIFDVRHNDEGKPFVIMEYVAGPSLKDLLDDSPSGLGVQKAAFFLREIAKGLTFLHDRGIVHRDLKPGNVFYEDGYVKIGDYGLSKAMTASRYSGQTITVGTVHYMAPEIGQGRYDCGVDIYALGCCLYEMLTGNVPFFGSSHGEILMKHLMAEPDLTGIEEPFAGAIRKALAKDPADRFKSAQEMVEAVFGAEHVRNSVSCFSPDSLTMVAGRVAQRVAVGGPGSSADAVRLGPPPRDPAGHRGAGILPAPRSPENRPEGGQDARPPSDDPWVEFAQRMDQFGQQMGQIGERIGERMRHVGRRFSGRIAQAAPPTHAPGFSEDTGEVLDSGVIAFADPKRDPLRGRHRRPLALIAIGATGVGGAIVGADEFERNSALTAWWLALSLTFGVTWGLSIASRFRDKLRHESGLLTHLAFGGMACLMAAPFFSVCAGMARRVNEESIMATGLTVAIALFLVDWRKRTAPGREERVSLGAAFMAGLTAWIIGLFTEGAGLLATAVLAGTSLAIQVAAPFDPHAIRQPNKRKKKTQWYGVNPANEVPGVPPPARPYAGRATDEGQPARTFDARQPGRMAYAPPLPARKVYVTPPWLRAIFLALFLLLAGTGLMLVIWGGLADTRPHSSTLVERPYGLVERPYGSSNYPYGTRLINGRYVYRTDPVEAAMTIAFGCGCMGLSLFFLFRALRRTYHGIWSSFVKPTLMLLCLQSIITSSVVMGTDSNLRDDEVLIGLAFIIFPGILLLLLLFIGDRAIRSVFSGIQASLPAPRTPLEASDCKRLWALLLALLGVFPIAGMHRFYVGKLLSGFCWLFTGGLLGVGTLVDIVLILTGRFRDNLGRRLLIWHGPELTRAFPVLVPAAAPPPAAGVTPPTQEPAVAPDLELQPAVDVPPPAPSAVWPPSAYGPQLAPRQTSTFWTLIGWLPISLAILVWLTVTVLPILVAAGFPDGPGSAAYFESAFGYEEWPRLLGQLGTILAIGLMLMGVVALVLARRAAGGAHILRAVLGTAGLGLCFFGLHAALYFVAWPEVFSLSRQNRFGPAIERLLNEADSEWLLFSCCCLLVGTLLLAWPERRRQINEVSGPVGGGR